MQPASSRSLRLAASGALLLGLVAAMLHLHMSDTSDAPARSTEAPAAEARSADAPGTTIGRHRPRTAAASSAPAIRASASSPVASRLEHLWMSHTKEAMTEIRRIHEQARSDVRQGHTTPTSKMLDSALMYLRDHSTELALEVTTMDGGQRQQHPRSAASLRQALSSRPWGPVLRLVEATRPMTVPRERVSHGSPYREESVQRAVRPFVDHVWDDALLEAQLVLRDDTVTAVRWVLIERSKRDDGHGSPYGVGQLRSAHDEPQGESRDEVTVEAPVEPPLPWSGHDSLPGEALLGRLL